MSTFTQTCEYQECQCTVTAGIEGGGYCSDVCQARDGTDEQTSIGCECGHPPCDATD